MKAKPVYLISEVVLTLTHAEAQQALEHPESLQSLLAATLQNGHDVPEHVADELPALPVASPKHRPGKKPAKSAAGKRVKCDECGREIIPMFMRKHMKAKHGIELSAQTPRAADEEE